MVAVVVGLLPQPMRVVHVGQSSPQIWSWRRQLADLPTVRGAIWGKGSAASVIGRYDVLARAREKPHVERTDSGRSRLLDAC